MSLFLLLIFIFLYVNEVVGVFCFLRQAHMGENVGLSHAKVCVSFLFIAYNFVYFPNKK